jgi:putative NIF3 family GTP cyclohydrolase 1 type 2
VTHTIEAIEEYLDRRLTIGQETDRTGNGLLVRGNRPVQRIGAALNTSFAVIDAAASQQIDLLLVHHAPWAEIDLHLRAQKIEKLSDLGISLYAAHETLDRSATERLGETLAASLALTGMQPTTTDLVVGTAPAIAFDAWLRLVSERLNTSVRAWPNNRTFQRVAVVPGGGGSTHYLAAAVAAGCDTFVTGEGSLYTELFAFECGLNLVYATHTATEFPAICVFAASVAAELGLLSIDLPETASITGGGPAPLEYGRIRTV